MALVRGLHLAATLSLLGTVGFIAWILPAAAVVAGSVAPPAGQAVVGQRADRSAGGGGVVRAPIRRHRRRRYPVGLARCDARGGDGYPLWQHCAGAIGVGVGRDLARFAVSPADTRRAIPDPRPHRHRPRPAGPDRPCRRHGGRDRRRPGPLRIPSICLAAGLWLGALLPLWLSLCVLPPGPGGAGLRALHPDRTGLRPGPRRYRFRPGAGTDRQPARPVRHAGTATSRC